jgi:hypothetical protein
MFNAKDRLEGFIQGGCARERSTARFWRRPLLAILISVASSVHAQEIPFGEHWQCLTETPQQIGAGVWENPWTDGIVYYTFNPTVDEDWQKQIVLDAFALYEERTGLVFLPRVDEPNWIDFQRLDDICGPDVCCGVSQWIGMKGGMQYVRVTTCGWTLGLMTHEIGHALGLWHEQQRSDRDEYVEILYDNIDDAYEGNFDIAPGGTLAGVYDFASTMHYLPFLWTVGGATIEVKPPYRRFWQTEIGARVTSGQEVPLSLGDVYALQDMYGGPAMPPRPFVLDSPAPNALVGAAWSPQFAWMEAQAATSYRLQVDDNIGFTSPEIDVLTMGTEYTYPDILDADTLYFWRVIASNAEGSTQCFHVPWQAIYTSSAYPTVLHVDDSAPEGGDGSSWAAAMNDLKAATEFGYASEGVVTEIRVGQGVYRADMGSGDRNQSFHVPPECALVGGYAGYGALDPDDRDPSLFPTFLTGDLLADDGMNFENNGENSYHVVRIDGGGPSTRLDGFVIAGGNADEPTLGEVDPYYSGTNGAGLLASLGSPVVSGCLFTGNSAHVHGGGMAIWASAAQVDACQVVDNRSHQVPVTFGSFGGGISVQFAAPIVTNGLIARNTAGLGGGIVDVFSTTKYVNSTVTQNEATDGPGGAFLTLNAGNATISNSVLWGNTAPVGDEIAIFTFPGTGPSTLSVDHSDVAGGLPGVYVDPGNTLNWGAGNIDCDPLFADAGAGNFQPLATCVTDAGANCALRMGIVTDLDGNQRFVNYPGAADVGVPGCEGGDAIVDRGAYERQCLADANGDGNLNILDFVAFQGLWQDQDPAADCDANGAFNILDFVCYQGAFTQGCP